MSQDRDRLIYLAGIFDGEGCIHIARTVRVVVSGCFRPGLLEMFVERWGSRVTPASSRKPNQRPGIRWEVTGPKAVKVLGDLLPFLFEKRQQAELAIKYSSVRCGFGVKGGRGYSEEQKAEFDAIAAEIKKLKKIRHAYHFA